VTLSANLKSAKKFYHDIVVASQFLWIRDFHRHKCFQNKNCHCTQDNSPTVL